MATRGIHAVWTTYGTWLPGDYRGHFSPLLDKQGHVVAQGGTLNPPDTTTHARALENMNLPRVVLSTEEISIVAETIAQQLTPGMPGAKWRIHTAAIEHTHIHLLFGPLEDPIGNVVGRLKSRASAAIVRHSGRTRTWTSGYWKGYIFDDEGMYAVIDYITQHNLRRNAPAHPYAWITPT